MERVTVLALSTLFVVACSAQQERSLDSESAAPATTSAIPADNADAPTINGSCAFVLAFQGEKYVSPRRRPDLAPEVKIGTGRVLGCDTLDPSDPVLSHTVQVWSVKGYSPAEMIAVPVTGRMYLLK